MEIINEIKKHKKSEIKKIIDNRIKEFEEVGKNKDKIFSELCFCILTANSSADNCIRVQKEAGKHFETLNEVKLAGKFKEAGCRFHTKRANYIVDARKNKQKLLENLEKLDEKEMREWLSGKTNGEKNIKGIGMKEASHFLRNIGCKNIAIIDFHIIDLLVNNKIIKKPKKLDKKVYLEIEKKLKEIAKKTKTNLAELDLYLWYMETGKVLK